ncbi:MAG: hypothetical protein RLZZ453_788 [Chlamydiota bacterium]|jgi:hypothetical protein
MTKADILREVRTIIAQNDDFLKSMIQTLIAPSAFLKNLHFPQGSQ